MMYGSKITREDLYGALANAIVEAWTGNVPGRKGGRVSLKQSSLVTELKAGGDPVNVVGSRDKTADKVRLSRPAGVQERDMEQEKSQEAGRPHRFLPSGG